MELKYYLRGLGLGIVITAIIMGVAASRSRSMTDAEIIARAKQLGMIEGVPLTERLPGEKEDTEEVSQDAGENDDSLHTGTDGEQNGNTVQNTDLDQNADLSAFQEQESGGLDTPPVTDSPISDTPADAVPDTDAGAQEQTQPEEESQTQAAEEQEGASSQQVIASLENPAAITIGSGDGSYEVSQKLADIGAVSSAAAYDTYLCENGYDKRIRTGMHMIPAGASEAQIARIITGME